MSNIEWTEQTWNPTTGCTKVSSGCKNCYAEKMHKRLQAMKQAKYLLPFTSVQEHKTELDRPKYWKKPSMVFVNSMSDLFHASVDFAFLQKVFNTMNNINRHTYQVLTKRSSYLKRVGQLLPWETISGWALVLRIKRRIDDLRDVPAKVRFLSIEPLLEDVGDLNLKGIHWVIVGGESGPGARLIKPAWVRSIRDQCIAAGVPFFFKQWGGVRKKKGDNVLDGKRWMQYPEVEDDN